MHTFKTVEEFIQQAQNICLSIEEQNEIRHNIETYMGGGTEVRVVAANAPLVILLKKYKTLFSLSMYGIIQGIWKRSRSLKK